MKKKVAEYEYICEVCGYKDRDPNYVEKHEKLHEQTQSVSVGQKVKAQFSSSVYGMGHYEGDETWIETVLVIDTDIQKHEVLIERENKTREWIDITEILDR